MADVTQQNITLAQLQLALERIKAYDEGKYSQLGHTHQSDEVVGLRGYVMAEQNDVQNGGMHLQVAAADSLNVAIGKIERSIFNVVENIGAIDVKNHKHDDIYYQKTEIDGFIDTLEQADIDNLAEAKLYTDTEVNKAVTNLIDGAPEALDTLNELAKALGDDENFAATMATELGKKVTGPASAVDSRVAIFDGTTGKLVKDSGLTIETSVPPNALFTDYKVTTTPNASAMIYLAGTKNVAGETGTLEFDPAVYLDAESGKLVAPTVVGNLTGKADFAGQADVAVKTQAALTVKFNDTVAGTFDGNVAKEIVITPEAINAHDRDYTQKASDSDVESMLNDLFPQSV